LDLGDVPFEVAGDLPAIHVLDIHMGDTYALNR